MPKNPSITIRIDSDDDRGQRRLEELKREMSRLEKELSQSGGRQGGAGGEAGRQTRELEQRQKEAAALQRALLQESTETLPRLRQSAAGAADELRTLAAAGGESESGVRSLRSALESLRFSFFTAFAPIAEAVVPALATLIGWVARALDAVAQLMAVLSGKNTYKKASAGVASVGSAAKGASGSVKELKRQLTGLDEMRRWEEPSAGGRSGGRGGSGGGGISYEEVPVDEGLSAWADKLREFWQNLWHDGILDFSSVSLILPEKDDNDTRNWAQKLKEKLQQTVRDVFKSPLSAPVTVAYGIPEDAETKVRERLSGLLNGLNVGVNTAVVPSYSIPADAKSKAEAAFSGALNGLTVGMGVSLTPTYSLPEGAKSKAQEALTGALNGLTVGVNLVPRTGGAEEGLQVDQGPLSDAVGQAILALIAGGLIPEALSALFSGGGAEQGAFAVLPDAGLSELKPVGGFTIGIDNFQDNIPAEKKTLPNFEGKIHKAKPGSDYQETELPATGSIGHAHVDSGKFQMADVPANARITEVTRTPEANEQLSKTDMKASVTKAGYGSDKVKAALTLTKMLASVTKAGYGSDKVKAALTATKMAASLTRAGYGSEGVKAALTHTNMTATIVDKIIKPSLQGTDGNLRVNAQARIVSVVGSTTLTQQTKAKGGAFYGGAWHDIPQYAGGTAKAHGSVFIAGEAGPEVVGHVNGRTEVLNKSQLAAAVSAGVARAISNLRLELSRPAWPAVTPEMLPAVARGEAIPPKLLDIGEDLESIRGTLERIAARLDGSGSRGNTYNVNVRADQRTLFQLMLEEGRSQQAITGRNPFALA